MPATYRALFLFFLHRVKKELGDLDSKLAP